MNEMPKCRTGKQSREVWVVLHCEYMRNPKHRFIDEMLFHLASSLKAAQRFIGRARVGAYSWWEVQRRFLDVADDDVTPETHFYSHTGRKLNKPPQVRALNAYKKHWAETPEEWKRGDPD
jgi:hypothetical protein